MESADEENWIVTIFTFDKSEKSKSFSGIMKIYLERLT